MQCYIYEGETVFMLYGLIKMNWEKDLRNVRFFCHLQKNDRKIHMREANYLRFRVDSM